MPIDHYGDILAEMIFLEKDPVMQEVRAELWPSPEPEPHGALARCLPPRRGVYSCPTCRQRTVFVGTCDGADEEGPCDGDACLWCGYSCLEWTTSGVCLRWRCRACGPPDHCGRCPACQTYGGWYQVEHLSYCTICEYRLDSRLFWGMEGDA